MELRTDNHYVPCSYFKPWADARSFVWTYRLMVSHANVPLWRYASVRGLAHRLHLYTRVAAGGETDEIERWLDREYEAPAQTAMQKVLNDQRLYPDDWHRLIRFVGAQDLRTPARLVESLKRWYETMPELVQSSLEGSVRELQEAHRSGQKLVRTPAPAHNFPAKVTTVIEPDADTATLNSRLSWGEACGCFRCAISSRIGLTCCSVTNGRSFDLREAARGSLATIRLCD